MVPELQFVIHDEQGVTVGRKLTEELSKTLPVQDFPVISPHISPNTLIFIKMISEKHLEVRKQIIIGMIYILFYVTYRGALFFGCATS